MFERILSDHEAAVYSTVGLISLASFVGSLFLLPALIARMPSDYFQRHRRPRTQWAAQHPALRWSLLVAKNIAGFVLLVSGVLMLVLPGQGLLTIFMGLILMDYPGKHRIERHLISRPAVLRAVNWLRKKSHAPPLQVHVQDETS